MTPTEILLNALLELRTIVPSGSEEMGIIDEACKKVGVYPWKHDFSAGK